MVLLPTNVLYNANSIIINKYLDLLFFNTITVGNKIVEQITGYTKGTKERGCVTDSSCVMPACKVCTSEGCNSNTLVS